MRYLLKVKQYFKIKKQSHIGGKITEFRGRDPLNQNPPLCFFSYSSSFNLFQILNRIRKIAAGGTKVIEILRERLSSLKLPEKFQAPFDPSITLGKLIVDKCKVMDSKKRPLWLEFRNADPFNVSDSMQVVR